MAVIRILRWALIFIIKTIYLIVNKVLSTWFLTTVSLRTCLHLVAYLKFSPYVMFAKLNLGASNH